MEQINELKALADEPVLKKTKPIIFWIGIICVVISGLATIAILISVLDRTRGLGEVLATFVGYSVLLLISLPLGIIGLVCLLLASKK